MELLAFKKFQPEDQTLLNKTPLFILHGLMGSKENWRTQAKHLSQYQAVYTLDLRNHGQSPHITGMSYREMYEDVIHLAKHLHIDNFNLLGHSMGGKVAMQLALSRPEFVTSLIVVDIAPKPYPLWHQKTLSGVMTVPFDTLKTRQVIDLHLKDSIKDRSERSFMLKNLKRNDENTGFQWRCNLEEISKGYLKIANFTTIEQQYNAKTLFIRGEDSNYISDADYPLIKSLFPQSNVITITASGHLPHIQNADEFFEHVKEFIA